MTVENPSVSVVIPVFNRESLVTKCLSSVVVQTYENLEIIVTDNCSEDATFDIVREFALRYPSRRFKLNSNPVNLGPTNNWLVGLRMATSTYAVLLFSDDYMDPHAIERLVYARRGSAIVLPKVTVISDDESRKAEFYPCARACDGFISPQNYRRSLLQGNSFSLSPCGVLVKSEMAIAALEKSLDFPLATTSYSTGAGPDIAMLFECCHHGGAVLSQAEVYFRHHGEALTLGSHGKLVQHHYRIAKINLAYRYDRALMLVLWWAYAILDRDIEPVRCEAAGAEGAVKRRDLVRASLGLIQESFVSAVNFVRRRMRFMRPFPFILK